MILDTRCPRCNQPVQGRQEVIITAAARKAVTCPKCKTKLTLQAADDLGARSYAVATGE